MTPPHTVNNERAIRQVKAREVLDSRGNPTVEVEVVCSGGASGRAISPSGASTGEFEAVELRDGGDRYHGKGVLKAVAHVRDVIAPELVGIDVTRQEDIDRLLLDLDGTTEKSKLGANAVLAVSLSAAVAAADEVGLPLFRYLGRSSARSLPVPFLNVVNGGVHASNRLDIQEYLIVPGGFPSFEEALRAGSEIYQMLRRILSGRGLSTNLGDEGGVAPELATDRETLQVLMEAIEQAGYTPGEQVALALDVAASEFYRKGRYSINGAELDSEELLDYLVSLVDEFPIVSIEDPMDEEDWEGWCKTTALLGDRVQLVGDDLFATNEVRLRRGIDESAANAILVKVNQIGTLSETLRTIEMAERASFGRMISHRSGETEDVFIAHLAVACGAGQIKAGAPARGERTAKYNELLRIAENLADSAWFPGWEGLGHVSQRTP